MRLPETGPKSIGVDLFRFAGTAPGTLSLGWPSLRPQSYSKSKIYSRTLNSPLGVWLSRASAPNSGIGSACRCPRMCAFAGRDERCWPGDARDERCWPGDAGSNCCGGSAACLRPDYIAGHTWACPNTSGHAWAYKGGRAGGRSLERFLWILPGFFLGSTCSALPPCGRGPDRAAEPR